MKRSRLLTLLLALAMTLSLCPMASAADGTLNYDVYPDDVFELRSADIADCLNVSVSRINYITGLYLSSSSGGSLRYEYFGERSTVRSGDRFTVNGSQPISDVAFVAGSNFSGTATLSMSVYLDYNNYRSVDIYFRSTNSYGSNSGSGFTITYTVDGNRSCYIRSSDINNRLNSDYPLSYVRIRSISSTSYGTLYYNNGTSINFNESTNYYANSTNLSSSRFLDWVYFKPNSDFRSRVTVYLTAYDTRGRSYGVDVVFRSSDYYGGDDYYRDDYYSDGYGRLSYTASGSGVYLNGRDIASNLGITLDYVELTSLPSSSAGTLYHTDSDGYQRTAGTGTRYTYRYSGSYNLDRLRFVPNSNFSGTAELRLNAYDTGGSRYSMTIIFRSSGSGSGSYAGYLTYETDGKPIHLSGGDLEDKTGLILQYATFSLQRSGTGKLVYDYTDADVNGGNVDGATRYYRSGSPSIDKVWFVPASGFTGNAEIRFTAYDASGGRSNGTITIRVTDTDSDTARGAAGAIVYSVRSGSSVYLQNSDFNSKSRSETGSSINTVRFQTLPSASQGTLYNGAGTSSPVSANYSYGSVSNLRFVANSGYTGIVSLRYTGTATNGNSFDGTVQFDVNGSGYGSDRLLTYIADPDRRVYFRAQDFSDAAYNAMNTDITRIRFNSLPSSSRGTLYDGTSRVSVSTSYYKSDLNDLNFYASYNFSGSVDIPFTGYGSNGRSFSGTVTVRDSYGGNGSSSSSSNTTYTGTTIQYSTNGVAVKLSPSDFTAAVSRYLNGAVQVRLQAPEEKAGQFCLDFVALSRFTNFEDQRDYPVEELSRISFLPKAGFSGTTAVSYTASDSTGRECTGQVSFVVTPPTASAYFYDMESCPWAVPAVDFFYSYGAVAGNARSAFGPTEPMKRGDFVLMLSRAFNFPTDSTDSGFFDVPAGSYYAAAIAGAKSLGVVGGSSGYYFNPERTITREESAMLIYRALRRVSAVSPGTFADLTDFSDCANTSPGAVQAMGALVRMGVFKGDAGRLRPRMPLSRAETITILYRALT